MHSKCLSHNMREFVWGDGNVLQLDNAYTFVKIYRTVHKKEKMEIFFFHFKMEI